MKQLASLFLLLLLSLPFASSAQDEPGFSEAIDRETGIQGFFVDARKKDLRPFLGAEIALDKDDFRSSSHQVDPGKLAKRDFFGLQILEITANFTSSYNEAGELSGEDLHSLIVHLKKPENEVKKREFEEQLERSFGPAEVMYDPDYVSRIKLLWWSDKTLYEIELGVELGEASRLGEELDFYRVTFSRAYGG